MKDVNTNIPPRGAGRLVQASWQLFTSEKIPFNEPVPVTIPEEITLAQLVAHFIIPKGFDALDSNTVFQWTPEVVPHLSRAGNKTTIVQIPSKIPPGFKFRGLANTLHADPDKRQVTCAFGTAKIRLSFQPGDIVQRLQAAIVAEMLNRGQCDHLFEASPEESQNP
jgi:hypothetical protein